MKLPLYQIDAFADALFEGNPAAVVPCESWFSDSLMQAIAFENNLSETAFFCPSRIRDEGRFDLRWFTPTAEVDLCGHATLASAYVIMHILQPDLSNVTFATKSGDLVVRKGEQGRLDMDFPSLEATPLDGQEERQISDELTRVLGVRPIELYRGANLLAIFEDEEAIRSLIYHSELGAVLSEANSWGMVSTAPGAQDSQFDFVSRFFAPAKGVPEDPVTGSAHCMMMPYWAKRLGRKKLVARQLSVRGGIVHCLLNGSRVQLSGRCVPYLEGSITLPGR